MLRRWSGCSERSARASGTWLSTSPSREWRPPPAALAASGWEAALRPASAACLPACRMLNAARVEGGCCMARACSVQSASCRLIQAGGSTQCCCSCQPAPAGSACHWPLTECAPPPPSLHPRSCSNFTPKPHTPFQVRLPPHSAPRACCGYLPAYALCPSAPVSLSLGPSNQLHMPHLPRLPPRPGSNAAPPPAPLPLLQWHTVSTSEFLRKQVGQPCSTCHISRVLQQSKTFWR